MPGIITKISNIKRYFFGLTEEEKTLISLAGYSIVEYWRGDFRTYYAVEFNNETLPNKNFTRFHTFLFNTKHEAFNYAWKHYNC